MQIDYRALIHLKSTEKIAHFLTILTLGILAFQLVVVPSRALGFSISNQLPVFTGDLSSKERLDTTVSWIQSAGYFPKFVNGYDMGFSVQGLKTPYLLVPMGNHLSTGQLSGLSRYVQHGGKLILLLTEAPASPQVAQSLLTLIGLEYDGLKTVGEKELLYWRGNRLPSADALTEGSQVITFRSGTPEAKSNTGDSPATVGTGGATVEATWGASYPAIVTTPKGAFLNWPSGAALSQVNRIMALHKAMPIALPESVVLGSIRADRMHRPGLKSLPNLYSQPEKLALESAAEPHWLNLAVATDVPRVKPGAKQPKNNNMKSAPPDSKSTKQAAASSAEDEVLGNILGITPTSNQSPSQKPSSGTPTSLTPDDPLLKEKMDTISEVEAGEKKQRHFSFLDPEAAEVLAPEFDYGTYTYNLRILDDYRQRIDQALAASKQLGLDFPEDRIQALLKEAFQHRRQFENLYLNNQTQAGLNAFAEARRLTLQALTLTTESPQVEGRAIWLDRSTIINAKDPAGMRQLMGKLHQAGINLVYFETINAGFPIYPSTIAKRNPMVQGWDPLQVAVDEGHKLGMEVHSWVWAFAVGNRRHNALLSQSGSYPGPILEDSGLMSEALRNRDGGLDVDGRQHEFWLSPASEKGRAFLLSLYKEIVTKYDVDGLQLDYIRYPFQTGATRMGFEPAGRERFALATGLSVDSLDEQGQKAWISWKTAQVTSFVKQVSEGLKVIRPQLKISAAVFPLRRESRIVAIQQDWETWVENGWVDTLSPMSYTSDPERLQAMVDYVQSSPKRQPLVYPGIAMHRLDGGQLVEQLEVLRQRGGLGATLFAGAHLNDEKVQTLGKGPFKSANSFTPHSNVMRAIQVIAQDYRDKLKSLQNKGLLTGLSVAQVEALSNTLDGFIANAETLRNQDSQRLATASHKPPSQMLRSNLQAFKQCHEAWLNLDRAQNPYRADYFKQKLLLLDELVAYYAGRQAILAEHPATVFPKKPTDSVKTAHSEK